MPAPQYGFRSVIGADRYHGIALIDGLPVYLKKEVLLLRVQPHIAHQVGRILPYQHGVANSGILIYVGRDYRLVVICHEIDKHKTCHICSHSCTTLVGIRIISGIAVYKRKRVVARCVDHIAVGCFAALAEVVMTFGCAIGRVGVQTAARPGEYVAGLQ